MRASSGYIFATAILLVASSFLFARAQGTGTSDKPKSRADWPTERVTVVGKRGSVRDWLVNHTFRGTEGFADGSAPADVGSRFEYYWQIYYMADGRLEAHFQKPASRVPHGPIEALGFVETGKWRINEDGTFASPFRACATASSSVTGWTDGATGWRCTTQTAAPLTAVT